MKKYYLKINGKKVEVTEEVYKAFYQETEHERYLTKIAVKHECSFDMLEDIGFPIETHLKNHVESVEEILIKDETWAEIMGYLKLLTPYERKLITEHYLYDIQQVILAKRNDKTKQAINQSINRIIKKIRKMKKF